MGPRNAYKDMLDNVVSSITCVSMNHQNQLEQMANGVMFATKSDMLVCTLLLTAKGAPNRFVSMCSFAQSFHPWEEMA
jgi:hypothetical protein